MQAPPPERNLRRNGARCRPDSCCCCSYQPHRQELRHSGYGPGFLPIRQVIKELHTGCRRRPGSGAHLLHASEAARHALHHIGTARRDCATPYRHAPGAARQSVFFREPSAGRPVRPHPCVCRCGVYPL